MEWLCKNSGSETRISQSQNLVNVNHYHTNSVLKSIFLLNNYLESYCHRSPTSDINPLITTMAIIEIFMAKMHSILK